METLKDRCDAYLDKLHAALEAAGFDSLMQDPDFADKWRFHWDSVIAYHGEDAIQMDPAFAAGMIIGQHLGLNAFRDNAGGMTRAQRRQLDRDRLKGRRV